MVARDAILAAQLKDIAKLLVPFPENWWVPKCEIGQVYPSGTSLLGYIMRVRGC